MVLEALISPEKAEKTPMLMVIYGFIFASISIILSLLIFKEEASMVAVFLTVMVSIPLTLRLLLMKNHMFISL